MIAPSKVRDVCAKSDGFRANDDGFCAKDDGFCAEPDGVKMMDFMLKLMDIGKMRRHAPLSRRPRWLHQRQDRVGTRYHQHNERHRRLAACGRRKSVRCPRQ